MCEPAVAHNVPQTTNDLRSPIFSSRKCFVNEPTKFGARCLCFIASAPATTLGWCESRFSLSGDCKGNHKMFVNLTVSTYVNEHFRAHTLVPYRIVFAFSTGGSLIFTFWIVHKRAKIFTKILARNKVLFQRGFFGAIFVSILYTQNEKNHFERYFTDRPNIDDFRAPFSLLLRAQRSALSCLSAS